MKLPFSNANEAEIYVGGLSKPSKMPCPSYSIPAQRCKIGAIMRDIKGSVCSTCYALKGNYSFPCVKNALERRFQTLKNKFWIEAFVMIINERGLPYFRWHDSGDIQGVWHLKNIVEVAKKSPKCQFWLPTREASILNEYMETIGEIPSNLTIRISGTMIDGPAPVGLAQKYNLNISSVTTDLKEVTCFAFKNNGKCGYCRLCWDKEVFNTTYLKH